MSKRLAFLIYAWGSTAIFSLLIIWLATIPNLRSGTMVTDEVIKVVFRMSMYAILFILIYRSIIITLKTTVERLSKWRSKREEIEDSEFVLIIETLAVVLVIFATTTFAFAEEHIQFYTQGRNRVELSEEKVIDGKTYVVKSIFEEADKDILVSVMSILLTAIVVYSIPVIGELEMAIKHKYDENKGKKKKD
jgi:undecaprenyl pyrophosphate phosphatase UppP